MWVELDGWTAKLRFSACHLIPHHPKCGRLHGHTYAVSVKVFGERTGEFIIDFEILKGLIAEICERLDHRVILAENDTRMQITKDDQSIIVEIGGKMYQFPIEDVTLVPTDSTSAESLCEYVASELAPGMSPGVSRIEIRIDEGLGQGAGFTLDIAKTGDRAGAGT